MLDSTGRWILGHLEYRVCALLALGVVALFVAWRKHGSGSWPSILELCQVAFGFLSILGGVLVGVVFLLTRPPAISELSTDKLVLIGVITPMATLYLGCRQISAAFFPTKVLPPDLDQRDQDKGS